jgi:uncharacterized RDD family membrane protein YckC
MLPQPSPFDQHTIETPEQMSLHLTLAGIGSRFLAMAVDTLIQAAAGIALLVVLGFLGVAGAFAGLRESSLWVLAALVFGAFLLLFGYFAAFELAWNGQTPGKRVIGIRVVKDSGRPLTPAETIGRNLLRIVDQLPALYALGVLVALLNAQNKRLGDFIAGSIVIREGTLGELKPIWQSASTTPPPLGVSGSSALSVEDLILIDTFLNRRSMLTPDVRSRMAAEILERLKPRLSVSDDGQSSVESILEFLVYQRRAEGRDL